MCCFVIHFCAVNQKPQSIRVVFRTTFQLINPDSDPSHARLQRFDHYRSFCAHPALAPLKIGRSLSMEAKLFGHKIGRLNLPQQLASSVRLPPLRSPAEKSQTILQKALAWWLGRQNSDAEPTFIAARSPLALQDFLNKPLLQRVRPDSFVQ